MYKYDSIKSSSNSTNNNNNNKKSTNRLHISTARESTTEWRTTPCERKRSMSQTTSVSVPCVCGVRSYIPCHQYIGARRFLIGYMLECVSLSPDTLRPDTTVANFVVGFGALYACACVRASIHFAICMFGCALKRRSVQPSQLYYMHTIIVGLTSHRVCVSLSLCLFSGLTVSKTFSSLSLSF